MRRSLLKLNERHLPKALRQALVLLTMLFLPSAAWGQTITVAGVEPDGSGTFAGITGVTFDGTTQTLTLDNAQVNGTVSTSLTQLNVHIKGHSVFYVETNSNTNTYLFNGSGASFTLNYSAESIGDVLEGIGTADSYKLKVSSIATTENYDGTAEIWKNSNTVENGKDYCKLSKPYLYVGDIEIDKSNYNSFEDYFSFDAANFSLTISGIANNTIAYDWLVKSFLANLTVNISDNIIYQLKTGTSTGKVFVYTGTDNTSTLTLNIAEGKTLRTQWNNTSSGGNTGWINSGFSDTNISTDLSTMESSGVYAEETQASTEYAILFSNVELYDLSVAGTRVTSINSANILNDANSSVSFTPAEGETPAKLTLNNANFTVNENNAIESGLDNLTVYLVGDQNNIVCQGSNDFAFKGTKSGAKVTFATNAKSPGKLTGQVPETRVFDGITREYQGLSYNRNGDSFTISAADYGISIGGVAITSACVGDDGTISGVEGITSGTVKFTPADATTSTPATLTLEGATVTGPILSSNNLEIALKGTNTITSTDSATVIRSLSKDAALTFSKLGDTSLTVTHVDQGWNAPSIISGFTSIDYTTAGLYMQSSEPTKYESVNIAPLEADKTIKSLVSAIYDSTYEGFACIHSATITSTETYPIWVNGNQITSSYAGGDGVSYDDANKKLTLTDANIDCTESGYYPIVSTIKDLQVHLVKSEVGNIIKINSGQAFKYVGEETDATLTFSTVDPSDYKKLGSLKIDGITSKSNIASVYAIKGLVGETSIPIIDENEDDVWGKDLQNSYDTDISGWKYKEDGSANNVTILYRQVYDLWISSGESSRSRYVSDHLGDEYPGISFDPGTSTLSYEYSDQNLRFYSGLPSLKFIPGIENAIACYITYNALGNENTSVTSGTLTIAKPTEASASAEYLLTLAGYETNPVISGFTSVTYDDFTILSDGAKYDTEKKQLVDANGTAMTAATFATSVNLEQPRFGSSQNEDVVTISMFNSNDYGTIKYSIDYADGSTGVTDATYDPDNELTMSKPGTLTAYVQLNGETSDISTGKYIGAKQEVFTVAIGDKIEGTSWFTPEIKAEDQIESEFMTQEGDESGIFEKQGEGSDFYLVAKKSGTTTINASLWSEEGTTVLNSDLIALTFNVGESLSSVFEGENTYGALYSETAIQVPEGMKAYVITGIDEEKGTVITSVVDFIPAGVPVLLENEGEAKAITHIPYTGSATAPTNNKLNYSNPNSPAKPSATDNWYVIYNNKFVKVTAGSEVRGGKCYLNLNGTTAGTRGFYNIGGGEGTTSLREVISEGVNSKKWADGEWYTLQGQRVVKPAKGLYILNGKKVVVK